MRQKPALDLSALSLFVRAAELGNITAAGREAGLAPSVASERLAKLEASLGMRLLHRTTRQVTVTEDGAEFLPHAVRVLAAVDEAYLSRPYGQGAAKRVLKLAAPTSFAQAVLMPIIVRFLDAHPNLKIDLVLSDWIQDLTEIGVDLAIRIDELKDSTHVAREIGTDDRVLCAAPAYLARRGTPKSPEELPGHECVLLGAEDRWTFAASAGGVTAVLDGSLRVNSGDIARLAAEPGLGIASISTWNARRSLAEGRLVQVLADFPLEQRRRIWAIYPSARLISSKARSFVEFLMAAYRSDPAVES